MYVGITAMLSVCVRHSANGYRQYCIFCSQIVEVPVEIIQEKLVEKPIYKVIEVPVPEVMENGITTAISLCAAQVPVERVVEREVEKVVVKQIKIPVEQIKEKVAFLVGHSAIYEHQSLCITK